jgi:hypothetical protein
MKTECNCDLPTYAYYDWLIEEGWTPCEEELEYVTSQYGGHLEGFGVLWDSFLHRSGLYVSEETFSNRFMLYGSPFYEDSIGNGYWHEN